MFDFGFSEILLIFVLALIVLGPEKLPAVVRRVGRWVGRARAMARQFQEQLEEEIDLEDRRRPASVEPETPGAPAEGPETAHHDEPAEAPEREAHTISPDATGPSGEIDTGTDAAGTHEPRA